MSTSQTQHSPVSSESSDDSGKQLITWQESVVLLSISIKHLVVLTFVPSILSLILVFVIGFGIDYLELLNYEWTCGVSLKILGVHFIGFRILSQKMQSAQTNI
jgi:hypothetical protein